MSYHGKLQTLKNGTADSEIQLWAYQQIETIDYLYKTHDTDKEQLKAAEQMVLDAFERGKSFGFAEGMRHMKRPDNVVGVPSDELKKMQNRLAHLEKMIVWYQDITMTGINSEDYENGFWDAVNFVKWHQVKDKN